MKNLPKLQPGDKVAILSPSFAAPGMFPAVYELGLKRLREVFELEPVEFATTKKLGASKEERASDLLKAFEDNEIKGVIATIGGNDQVTYIKDLPREPFINNPKLFFGYSDNTHFMNFLWLCGIPSFYGGSLMTQFAMQYKMDDYTIKYLKNALFESNEVEIQASIDFNDVGLDWKDESNLLKKRVYEKNDGFYWDGTEKVSGITWGGCLESIDEILRHGVVIPSLDDFRKIVLITETSEEIPSDDYVFRFYRALGERGILARVQAILVGRPKAWEFNKPQDVDQRNKYRKKQRETILKTVRTYNTKVPVVQNVDFGHTDPQVALPYGASISIDGTVKKIVSKY
jgi:muramoyltetrapeptide carboxypeptidase LdcA involved in peptidoglycan recycling